MTDMDATERALAVWKRIFKSDLGDQDCISWVEQEIRQAETLAHEKGRQAGLEEAAQRVKGIETLKFWDQLRYEMYDAGPHVVDAIRALKDKPEGGQ